MTLSIRRTGQGVPVVFVHGSAGDARVWSAQEERFAQDYRAIVYSRRYHWPNPPPSDNAEYSMSEQVDDLAKIVEEEERPVHIVGHSYGASLALSLVIRSPHIVQSLVLAEPPVIPLFTSFPPKPHEIMWLLLRRPSTGLAIVRFATKGLLPATAAAKRNDMDKALALFGRAVLGNKTFEAMSAERLEQARVNLHQTELLSDSFMEKIKPADVRRIRVPTLLIVGDKSPKLFGALADRLGDLIPNVKKRAIKGASHNMNETHPTEFNAAVLDFLGRK